MSHLESGDAGSGGRGPVTVGIDVGTTSVKAVAVTETGRVVASCRLPHPVRVPSPGRLEHDAELAWREGPRRALATLQETAPAAVAVSAMAPSMTAVDGYGAPVGPGLLYGDERGRAGAVLGAPLWADPTHSPEALGLLRWVASHRPDAAGYWPAQAVANRALGATAAIDLGTAFATGPLLGAGGWDKELCASCGVDTIQLPAVKLFGEVIGEADGGVRGPGPGTVIGAGGVDALCEQLVAGADRIGDVLVVCGATLVVWTVAPESAVDPDAAPPGCWVLPHWRGGAWMVGGASNAGGLWLDWIDRVVRPADASTAAPGSVPVLAPYLRGERVPLHDPGRRAEMRGLDLTQGPAELRRAAYEASAFAVRHILERSGVRPHRLVATGGGSRVAAWMKATADVTGLAVETVAVPEGGALGAAFLARMAAGLETEMTDAGRWSRRGPTFDPDPAWRAATVERYETYRAHAESPPDHP